MYNYSEHFFFSPCHIFFFVKEGFNILRMKLKETRCAAKSAKLRRRYQIWEGRNSFLCWGICMTGCHTQYLMISYLTIITSWVAFVALACPLLVKRDVHIVVSISFLLFQVTTLTNVAFTEPGILPRYDDNENIRDSSTTSAAAGARGGSDALLYALQRNVNPLGQYCTTCKIIRPPRAKHCRHCNNCVEMFDHHCPWTSNCIGVRNYPQFFLFITSILTSALYVLYAMVCIVVAWVRGIDNTSSAPLFGITVVSVFTIWALLVACVVGMLVCLHVLLIYRDQTTSEFLRGYRHQDRALLLGKQYNPVSVEHGKEGGAEAQDGNPQQKLQENRCGGGNSPNLGGSRDHVAISVGAGAEAVSSPVVTPLFVSSGVIANRMGEAVRYCCSCRKQQKQQKQMGEPTVNFYSAVLSCAECEKLRPWCTRRTLLLPMWQQLSSGQQHRASPSLDSHSSALVEEEGKSQYSFEFEGEDGGFSEASSSDDESKIGRGNSVEIEKSMQTHNIV